MGVLKVYLLIPDVSDKMVPSLDKNYFLGPIQGWIQGVLGAQAPLTTKNEAQASKFYNIEAPEWQF